MRKLVLSLLALLLTIAATAQMANQNVSGGLVFEGEPYLAVNPADPNHIVVAWIGFVFAQQPSIKTRTSMDGGQTWSATAILPHYRSTYKSADPSLVFDVNGDVLACYVDYRQTPDSGGTFVVRSTDGGLSWGAMVQAIDAYDDALKLPVDRPWLSIDRSGGAHDGNLYLTTKPAPWVAAPNRPYFLRSTDGGATWSNWQHLDASGFLVGNFIAAPMATHAVGSDGHLHFIYPSYLPSQNVFPGYIHAMSSDGGGTLAYNDAWFGSINANDSLIKAGYKLIADPSDPLRLAMLTPQNLLGDQDIYCLLTSDGGNTWSAPVRVNDDAPSNQVTQDLVWGGFDNDGDLVVTWRDRRNAAGSGYQVASEIWGSVWWHDSTSFEPNFRISDTLATWNAVLTQSGNDFMCSEMVQDTLFAAWGDTRNGRLNIYFVKFDLRSLTPTSTHQLGSEQFPNLSIYPNPAKDEIHVQGEPVLEMALIDANGKVQRRSETNFMDLNGLVPGTYLLRMQTAAGELSAKILKQ